MNKKRVLGEIKLSLLEREDENKKAIKLRVDFWSPDKKAIFGGREIPLVMIAKKEE